MSGIGSIIGPIIVALFLQANLGYSEAIGVLAVPALIAIFVLVLTIKLYPQPMELEKPLVCDKKVKEHQRTKAKLPGLFWIYVLAAGLLAASFIDFPLIAYHMSVVDHLPSFWIPMLYALAMGLDAISALIFGHFYDEVVSSRPQS